MHFRLILLVASLAHAIAIDSSISGDVPYQSDHDLSAGISPYGALDDSAIDDVSNQVPEKCNIHSVDEKTSYKSPDNDNNAAVPAQNSFDDGVLALDDGDSRLSPRQMLDGIIKFFTKPDEESSCKPNRRPEPQPQPEPYHSSPNGPIYCPNDQDNYVCCLGEPQPYIGYMVTRPNGINWNVDQCSNSKLFLPLISVLSTSFIVLQQRLDLVSGMRALTSAIS